MNKRIVQFLMFVVIAFFGNCAGKDGDPGPQGPAGTDGTDGTNGTNGTNGPSNFISTAGGIKGTVSGTRKDGTAFSEAFNYRLATEKGYTLEVPLKPYSYITFTRYGEPGTNQRMTFGLKYENNTISEMEEAYYPDSYGYKSFEQPRFYFTKELPDNSIFSVTTDVNYGDLPTYWPVSPAENDAKYNFDFEFGGGGGAIPMYMPDIAGSVFRTRDGKRVVFGYDRICSKVFKSDGTETALEPYNDLEAFVSNTTSFHRNGEDLSLKVIVPGDKLTVSNYSFDSSTGILKFDFNLQIAAFARANSTRHPLVIDGHVDVVINGDITSRAKG